MDRLPFLSIFRANQSPMQIGIPVIKDLVLIGGGHSHVAVLKAFGMRPLAGVRITLISQDTQTIYSGMLPGLIAGHYSIDQAHIDLVPLARFAGARFIRAKAIGIDHQARTVNLEGRPPVSYDILSINSGSLPSTGAVVGAEGVVIPVKPINQFLVYWQQLLQRVEVLSGKARIAVIGGGAGAVELALSVQYALDNLWKAAFSIDILTADPEILVGYHPKVGKRFRRILSERRISIHVNSRVTDVDKGFIRTASGRELEFEEILWVTQAGPPSWLENSGLGVDGEGFLLVDDHLQSVSHPDIFGAGDAATMVNHPRPKSGVFAVRQGAPLARNLRSFLLKRSLSRYRPQQHYLSLIGTGAKYAVGARAFWSVEGSWVWSWKDWIDRRWMRRYQVLPEMSEDLVAERIPEQLIEPEVKDQLDDGMRCGGCGAKVGSDILAAALSDITAVPRDDVIVGLNHPDDAALISIPEGKLSVLSVDFFRPIVDDPFIFGKIAANHCLNDIFAMGAEVQSAMTIMTLPLWPEKKLLQEMKHMLSGAQEIFFAEGVALVGGHTGEGLELSLGFSVTGLAERNKVLHKATVQTDDVFILTKPLGTGTIFAADMRAKAKGRWVDSTIVSMLQSNKAAGNCLHAYGASACTDVTGFGLVGHLLEMLDQSSLTATLNLDALPVLDGAVETSGLGILSSLHSKNELLARRLSAGEARDQHPGFPMLFDPQTAGGLLASISAAQASTCIEKLRELGYTSASVIGSVRPRANNEPPIIIE